MTPELDSGGKLSALLVGPANRRSFRLADHEHRTTLGFTLMLSKPEGAKSGPHRQNARDVVRVQRVGLETKRQNKGAQGGGGAPSSWSKSGAGQHRPAHRAHVSHLQFIINEERKSRPRFLSQLLALPATKRGSCP